MYTLRLRTTPVLQSRCSLSKSNPGESEHFRLLYATPLHKHGKCLSSAASLWTHCRCALPSDSEGLLYPSPDISWSFSQTVRCAITCSNQASRMPASRSGLHEDTQIFLVEGAMHLHANAIGSHGITCVYHVMFRITSCQPCQG